MAKAIVRLTGSETHSRGGRSFKKGYPQTLTDKAEIEYYRTTGGFNVQYVDGKPGVAPPVAAPTAPPVEVDNDGIEDDDDVDDDEVEIEILTKAQLKDMKKEQLMLAGEERLVLFTGKEKKDDMIVQILEAQEQLQAEEDGDEDDE